MKSKSPSGFLITIPTSIMNTWHSRHTRGDERRIQESTNLSRPTISKALNHACATYETILKISNFYASKKTLLLDDIETEALKILNNQP